jgi:hypothetical protein
MSFLTTLDGADRPFPLASEYLRLAECLPQLHAEVTGNTVKKRRGKA